jgi:hypothetical protein
MGLLKMATITKERFQYHQFIYPDLISHNTTIRFDSSKGVSGVPSLDSQVELHRSLPSREDRLHDWESHDSRSAETKLEVAIANL